MRGDDTQKTPTHVSPAVTPIPKHSDETTGHGIDAVATRTAASIDTPALMIGPYRVIRTVGQGGMGVVYLARDDRLNRDVALKVIPAGPDADQTDLARFKIEAEAVRKLVHPNIVKLYDIGETGHEAYLAMEYVEGGTLHRRIVKQGPFDPISAAKLLEQLARACHYAHTQGVLHRDLKPSNILLHDEGPEFDPIPKLADFGLARQLDRLTRLTLSGTAVGTPHYMAPEQARGEKNVGPALDIHGLGGILYEMLTGQPPFSATDAAATMEQVVHRTPTPPNEIRPAVPAGLSAICLRCLEKSPNRRYPSAEALANDLRRFQIDPTDVTSFVTLPAEKKTRWPVYAMTAGIILFQTFGILGTWYIVSSEYRSRFKTEQQRTEELSNAEQRARLEKAINLCEHGQIHEGIDLMRTLPAEGSLPVSKNIEAWQSRVLEQRAAVPINGSSISAMAANGQRYAIARNSRVSVWKTDDWQREEAVWTIEGAATAIGWSEDGEQLAIGTADGKVWIGNAALNSLGQTPMVVRVNRPIIAVGFSFLGVRAIIGGESVENEYVPMRETKKKFDRFKLDESLVAAAISPISADAAIITESGNVRVFDGGNGVWHDLPPAGDSTALAYSPDGNVLAIGTRSGSVQIWDAISRTPLSDVFTLGGPIASAAAAVKGNEYTVVVSLDGGKTVELSCGRPFVAQPIRLANKVGKEVIGVRFTGEGSKVYVTSPSGISLWRVWDAKRVSQERDYSSSERFNDPAAKFSAPAAAGPDGSIVVGDSGGRLAVIGQAGETQQQTSGPNTKESVSTLAASPKGHMTSAASTNGKTILRMWENGMGGPAKEQEVHCRVNQEAFMPDGSRVLLACADGHVRVWDPRTGMSAFDLDCGSPVLSVAIDDTGKLIFAGCADGSAQLFNVDTQSKRLTIRHNAEVRSVAFRLGDLMTASADGSSRRWDAETGLPIGPAIRHPDAISAMDTWKELVATGGRGRYVRVWRP